MKLKRIAAGMILCMTALSLGGCASKKGNGRPIFEIEERAEQSYEMTKVMRGTIKRTGIVSASYAQTKQEKLKFSISGKRLDEVYVTVGKTVKKGDLLAQLRLESEESALAEYEYSIEQKELQKKQLTEQRDFLKAALEKNKWKYKADEYQEELDLLKTEFDYKIEDLTDELELLYWKQADLEKQVEGGRLYAGMDGTVTKMANIRGYVSDAEEEFIVISDSLVCAFQAYEADLVQYMKLGEMYTFHTSDNEKEYNVKLTKVDASAGMLLFELPEPDYSIPIGLRVLYTATKEERENTLYLPKAAVHEANGQYYVYYIDTDGIRKMKDVTIGLVADNHIEILGGLVEGDEVILN